jgi:hypothetical protein
VFQPDPGTVPAWGVIANASYTTPRTPDLRVILAGVARASAQYRSMSAAVCVTRNLVVALRERALIIRQNYASVHL